MRHNRFNFQGAHGRSLALLFLIHLVFSATSADASALETDQPANSKEAQTDKGTNSAMSEGLSATTLAELQRLKPSSGEMDRILSTPSSKDRSATIRLVQYQTTAPAQVQYQTQPVYAPQQPAAAPTYYYQPSQVFTAVTRAAPALTAPLMAAPAFAQPVMTYINSWQPQYAQPAQTQAAAPAQTQTAYAGGDYGFTSWLNSVRASYGLGPVAFDSDLASWAAMNNSHQHSRGLGHFVMGPARRQNAAVGSAATIGSQWMNSPAHRAALLDPSITAIGLAGSGQYWTLNVR